jgi:hypothetical protein
LALAYAAALVPALLMALTQPIWSRVDEAGHYDFIVQLGHGVYPVSDLTLISPETLSVSESTGVFKAFYPVSGYPAPDVSDVAPPPAGMSPGANAAWMLRHMWQLSRESFQTPLYYLLMVPFWAAADRAGGPFLAIYVLRVINALFVATLAPLAIVAARIVAPGRAEISALAAMLAILLPGLDLNGTRVSNDSLAAAMGGLFVVLLLRWTGAPWSWRRAVVAGGLLGLCMMVKLTLGGFFVAVAIAMLWPTVGQKLFDRAAKLAVASTIAIGFLAPWFVINLNLYGALTPDSILPRLSEVVPGPLTAAFVPLDIAVFHLTYWSGEPWGALPLSGILAALGALIVLTVPVALYQSARAKSVSAPLVVAVTAVAATLLVSLAFPAITGYQFAALGRYAYPALPAAAVLCALGLIAVVRSLAVVRAVAAAYVLIALAMVLLGAVGVPGPPAPPPRVPPPDARVSPVAVDASRQGLTIQVDMLASEPHADAVWVHIVATNDSTKEAEWTVPYYSTSTGLPVDLDPGQSVTGWIYVPGGRTDGDLRLRFTDVTTDDYASVCDIVLTISRPASPD